MRVLIFENNLMWSARLAKSISSIGHEAIVLAQDSADWPQADVAILNLAYLDEDSAQPFLSRLAQGGIATIAHAGHKEKALHAVGTRLQCDVLATNSELTFKVEDLLNRAVAARAV